MNEKKKKHEIVCLDSWAILAWLQGIEPAASATEMALAQRPYMSWINLGEVYYLLSRRKSNKIAHEILDHLRGKVYTDEATPSRVIEAAKIKSQYILSYADAFALATATAHNAILFTGDPEILVLQDRYSVRDIRNTNT